MLRLCTDPTNYPILYHCSSGKDRTGESHPAKVRPHICVGDTDPLPSASAGLITALILRCCEADTKDIIANYHESEIALEPVMPRIGMHHDHDTDHNRPLSATLLTGSWWMPPANVQWRRTARRVSMQGSMAHRRR